MNTWDRVIRIKRTIINGITAIAASQDRLITTDEMHEIEYYKSQIKRFTIYKNVGMPCFVR